MKPYIRIIITRLSSKIVQQNTQVPELKQFDMHLSGSCHLFGRTEIQHKNLTN